MTNETFTPNELLVLFSKYTPSVVLGFKDPLSGFLADEISEFYLEGLASLTSRGIAQIDNDKKLHISNPFVNWIKTICNPAHSMLVGWQGNGGHEQTAFHFLDNTIVELRHGQADVQGNYILRHILSPDEIFDVTFSPFYTGIYIDRDDDVGHLAFTDLEKIANHVFNNDENSAKQSLLENGISEKMASLFLFALKNARIKYSITSYFDRNGMEKPKSKAFSVISADGDIWLLKPSPKKNFVRLYLSSKTKVIEEIKSAIPKGGSNDE